MDDVREFIDVCTADLAPKSQTHDEVICTLREDAEKVPVVRVDGKHFEGTGDVFTRNLA